MHVLGKLTCIDATITVVIESLPELNHLVVGQRCLYHTQCTGPHDGRHALLSKCTCTYIYNARVHMRAGTPPDACKYVDACKHEEACKYVDACKQEVRVHARCDPVSVALTICSSSREIAYGVRLGL